MHWSTLVLVLLAAAVIAAPSHATSVCKPEIVWVRVTGKPTVGHVLHGHTHVRCAR